MSEASEPYDTLDSLIAGAKAELEGRLKGAVFGWNGTMQCEECERSVLLWGRAYFKQNADGSHEHIEPQKMVVREAREVEYEWRVHDADGTKSPLRDEARAREIQAAWEEHGYQCWLERRPVGEWERVE